MPPTVDSIRRVSLALFCVCSFTPNVYSAKPPSTDPDPTAPHPLVASEIERINRVVSAGPFAPTWESLGEYEVPQWYRDAKFGIFIHWGVYSVPAFGSEWYPRQMYIDAVRRGDNFFEHHRKTYGPQSRFGYKDFIPRFKADQFNPDAWAELFQQAGARYVVPVAEHHDGFPMYACGFTEWDASEMGPRCDVIAELSTAVRSRGMKFGVSSHRAFNWKYYVRRPEFDSADPQLARLYGRPLPFLFEPDAADYRERFEPQDEQFKDDWLARTCEVVDQVPIRIWSGSTSESPPSLETTPTTTIPIRRSPAGYLPRTTTIAKADGETAHRAIINYKWQRVSRKRAAVLDLERSQDGRESREPFWQTDTAVSSELLGLHSRITSTRPR